MTKTSLNGATAWRVAALAVALFFNVGWADAAEPSDAAVDAQLAALAAKMNAGGPVMMDARTRRDSVSTEPGKIIVFHYTLLTTTPEEYQPGGLEKELHAGFVDYYNTNANAKIFRDNGVTVKHVYQDSSGKDMGEVNVGPADLRKAP